MVDDWEVAREHITKDETPLGKGTFGLVFRGVYSHPTKVRLKCRAILTSLSFSTTGGNTLRHQDSQREVQLPPED